MNIGAEFGERVIRRAPNYYNKEVNTPDRRALHTKASIGDGFPIVSLFRENKNFIVYNRGLEGLHLNCT